ncbi:MAG: hypothetical protein LZF60_420038 [Nitrospira sp.]|nr:MAG: hypothetical protein LZF60_420038 [Nitrospira sp.]
MGDLWQGEGFPGISRRPVMSVGTGVGLASRQGIASHQRYRRLAYTVRRDP